MTTLNASHLGSKCESLGEAGRLGTPAVAGHVTAEETTPDQHKCPDPCQPDAEPAPAPEPRSPRSQENQHGHAVQPGMDDANPLRCPAGQSPFSPSGQCGRRGGQDA
jgi:hypothetical protein